LQTDYVDEWRLHNIWSMEELDQVTGPDGALQAALEAREKGLVRHISISGHTDPQVQVEALNRFPFTSVLIAVSVLDHFIASFAEEFLPVANAKGVATIGMKVLALGKLGHVYDRALRYTLGLPISTAIVGMESMEQLEANLAVAENFQPLSDAEKLEFYREVLPMVNPQVVRWKADDFQKPNDFQNRVKVAG
ncbi:MAG: aldo/keto reductase, partial [Chloroflexota bacterium]